MLQVIKDWLDKDRRSTSFVNNKPGDRWWSSFKSRHPDLVYRKPECIGSGRGNVSPRRIYKWFDDFEAYLSEQNAISVLEEPNRIFNTDETGIQLGGRLGDMVLAEVSQKHVQTFKNLEMAQVSALITTSAARDYLPPLILLPGCLDELHLVGKLKDSYFSWTAKGWMDRRVFYNYIANSFKSLPAGPQSPQTGPSARRWAEGPSKLGSFPVLQR